MTGSVWGTVTGAAGGVAEVMLEVASTLTMVSDGVHPDCNSVDAAAAVVSGEQNGPQWY